MARIVMSRWVSGEGAKGQWRLYHTVWIVLAMVVAVGITIPSIAGTPTVYRSSATVRFDDELAKVLLDHGGPTPALQQSIKEIGAILKPDYPQLGSHLMGLDYRPLTANTISVVGLSPSAAVSREIASLAADKLARRMYNQQGDAILREVLARQAWQAISHGGADSVSSPLLGDILLTAAVDRVSPRKDGRSIEQLGPTERWALTRQLEVLDDLKTLDVRNADVAIQNAKDTTAAATARESQRGAQAAQRAVKGLLLHLYRTYHTDFNSLQPSNAYVAQAASSGTMLASTKYYKLLVAGLVGLLGGLLTVMIDRSVGIVPTILQLWGYRELMRNIVGRDLKARYKNSVLGYMWSLLNPLLTMLIFWLVFGVLLRNDIPQFPIFLIVALLPWNFAVTSVSSGMRSVIDNSNLVKKVYFPRAILPITAVLSNLVNFLLALPVMLAVMIAVQWFTAHHIVIRWTVVYIPLLMLIQTIFLIGLCLLLSTMAVFFRDTTHIVDILIQLWIFITPVFFSLSAVTHGNASVARMVRWLNPMASLVDFYRDVLYGHPIPGRISPAPPNMPALDGVFRTLVTALVVLAIGAYVFQRNSSHFGEEL
ncbi:MAG: ABC transporter permease [Herpetosiphon sp.]